LKSNTIKASGIINVKNINRQIFDGVLFLLTQIIISKSKVEILQKPLMIKLFDISLENTPIKAVSINNILNKNFEIIFNNDCFLKNL